MLFGDNLHAAGWRQGKFICTKDHHLLNISLEGGDQVIIISQSCDLVNNSLTNQPNFEFIVAKQIAKADGNLEFGKNPRALDIQAETEEDVMCLRLIQDNKGLCKRDILKEVTPADSIFITDSTNTIIANWLAARYNRHAFPHAFNQRIDESKKRRKNLGKSATRMSQHVSAIMIKMRNHDELSEGEVYSINILFLINDLKNTIDINSETIKTPIESFVQTLKEANIDVVYAIKKENEVPYSIIRQYKPWVYDYISLKETPPHAMATT